METRNPIFVIFYRLESKSVGQLIDRLNTLALIERHQVPTILMFLDVGFILFLEQVVIELVFGRKSGAINLLEPDKHPEVMVVPALDRREARVLPTIIP